MRKYLNTTLLLAFILFTGLVSLQFQCNKEIGCGSVFSFKMGIRAYPDKEIISVGDTIWLEVNESTTLQDLGTGRMVNFSDAANLGSVIAFQKLAENNQFTIKAANLFSYTLRNGSETKSVDPEALREYLFEEKNSSYSFKLGVIPNEAGTFRLFFSNAGNVYRIEDNCTKAAFELNFENTNQHLNLYPNHNGPQSGGGVYYFKVIS